MFIGSTPGTFTYAGAVSVNSNTLDTSSFGVLLYYGRPSFAHPTISGVAFDGSAHNWSVAGNGSTAAFTASVNSPNGTLSLSSPADGATVPRSSAFNLSWTGSGSDSVYVYVGAGSHHLYKVVTGSSASFTAAEMGALPAGSAWVIIQRMKFTIKNANGGQYIVSASTQAEATVTLN